jgi:hypothetical protein
VKSCVPFSVFVSERSSDLVGSSRSPSTLALTQPGPWSIPALAAPRRPFKCRSHPLLGFHSPTGLYRRLPPRCEFFSRQLVIQRGSLSWGSVPYSDHQNEGSVYPGLPPPAPCVFRVLTSLDALLPFEPPNHFWPGRSWDSTFRALLLPHGQSPFPSDRALLAVALTR